MGSWVQPRTFDGDSCASLGTAATLPGCPGGGLQLPRSTCASRVGNVVDVLREFDVRAKPLALLDEPESRELPVVYILKERVVGRGRTNDAAFGCSSRRNDRCSVPHSHALEGLPDDRISRPHR